VLTGADGVRVQWHRHFRDVPPGTAHRAPLHARPSNSPHTAHAGPFLVVAHELFDALPVYHFEYTEKGWLERLVDLDQGEGPHHLRYVLSPGPTYATMALLRQVSTRIASQYCCVPCVCVRVCRVCRACVRVCVLCPQRTQLRCFQRRA
jgi:hypothetical protein